MSVRTQGHRRPWSRTKDDLADAAQMIALWLVIVPVLLVLVAAASLLGLR